MKMFFQNLKCVYEYFCNLKSKVGLMNKYIRKNLIQNMENSDTLKFQSELKFIKEGTAEIIEPPGRKVFYNPVQEFNRDLSVLVLQTFSKELIQTWNKKLVNESNQHFRILEALSATGLRSIRYAKEVPKVSKVIANDISEFAIQNMEQNIKHNKVDHIVQLSHSDAVAAMFNNIHPSLRFDAVDLDPYGSPTQFLDTAVQCVRDGGILMVTCTDLAVLCGGHPGTCYVKYGAIPLKTQSVHEMAIRIVLQSIQSHASRYKRYILPLLSISADYYVRVFTKLFTSPSACKNIPSKLSMMFHCSGCHSTTLQALGVMKEKKNNFVNVLPEAPSVGQQCDHCKGKFYMGGPIWTDPIHDQNFVAEMLKSDTLHEFNTSKRLLGMLTLIREELHDVPLYYLSSNLAAIMKCNSIPMMNIRSAIKTAGYRVSFSHAAKESIKTDAPVSFIWDIYREWIRKSDIKSKNIKLGSSADNLRKTPIQHNIDFSLRPDANPLSREQKLTRYQMNPTAFWGPGSKSSTKQLLENPKRANNQNKKKRARDKKCFIEEKRPKMESLRESN